MIKPEEVDHLARLARLELSTAERASLAKDLGQILDYVKELETAPVSGASAGVDDYLATNVLRSDTDPYPSAESGEPIKVKKIL